MNSSFIIFKSATVLLLFLIILPLRSQKIPIRFGKVDLKEVKKTEYEIDSQAEAIILVDYGRSWFEYNNTKERFEYRFERIRRIKILTKEGYSWADGAIAFYEGTHWGRERVVSLKGFTYNIEEGKLTKSKLEKESIFEEKVTQNWYQLKFALPNVKVGSVLEYSYTIISDYFSEFRAWNFQHSIPILWSEYRALVPEFFDFKQIQQGYYPFKTEMDNEAESFKVIYTEDVNQRRSKTNSITTGIPQKKSFSINSYSKKYRWTAENLPALRAEPFISSLQNYYSRIEFTLSSIKFPNQPISYYNTDYSSYNQRLLKRDSYSTELTGGGFLKNDLERLTSKHKDPKLLTIAIYDHIKRHMVWNEIKRKGVTKTLRSAYKDQVGSSGDINLILVLMLRAAGIDADPVILATRDNYTIHPVYPIDSKFNYVIAFVKLENEEILLDATDRDRPYYLLPTRCLNGKGWVVSEEKSGWINLRNKETLRTKTGISLEVEKNMWIGDVIIKNESLEAYLNIKKFNESPNDYKEDILNNADWQISDLTIVKDVGKSINLSHKFKIEHVEKLEIENVIYVNPILFTDLIDNPFKQEKRIFPVEFICPSAKTYMISIKIPSGFIAEEIPENKILSMPGKASSFRYTSVQSGNLINITIQSKLNKKVFSQMEYTMLREYFTQIAAKCSEQIVLKRKS